MFQRPSFRFYTSLAITLLTPVAMSAQEFALEHRLHRSGEAEVTQSDYARAEALLGWNARGLVTGNQVTPRWLPEDGRGRFWYRNRRVGGFEFILVDPTTGTREHAFHHPRLAAALSEATGEAFEPWHLPFETLAFNRGLDAVRVQTDDSTTWSCEISTYACERWAGDVESPVDAAVAPNGGWWALERDDNLWLRDLVTGESRALTTDGNGDVGWANHPEYRDLVTHERQGIPRPPVVAWSPDSRWILTHRLDERGVEPFHLLETRTGRPLLHSYRYPIPGDSVLPRFALFAFNVDSAERVRLDTDPMHMVDVTCCGPLQDSVWKTVQWSSDSQEVFFTRMDRGYQEVELLVAEPSTGEVRRVLHERSSTWLELNVGSSTIPNWRPVAQGAQVIWFSQRDGWGHLYRYEVSSGRLLNRITEGPWTVNDVLHLDESGPGGGWVYFTATGREEGEDPYHRHLYRVRLDGSGLEHLTPESADHDVKISPSGQWIVDTYSTPTSEPVTILRGADGREIRTLEEADFSELLATGWRWPWPFTVKARDGVTDIHGYLYLPSDFDSTRSYPVVDYIYPGPQSGAIGFRQAAVDPGGHPHALAELGFVVFTVDALGLPYRSRAFHQAGYGDLADNGLADHITALRQLALQYSWMDLSRVGIFGHSGGGFSSTRAILEYPEFYRVAVSRAGNHDNRSFGHYWGEKYHGPLASLAEGGDSYDRQANQELAHKLKGKLLLMYGTLDDRVHPNANLLLIDALVDANLDFDLVVLPNRNHGFGSEPYVIRRTWDHLVRHLLGVEPPPYRIRAPTP
ncbi:MAG: DPP IV N-terminal domain-containing protein [Gemmatimonadota bacterium]